MSGESAGLDEGFSDYEARQRAVAALEAQILPVNKQALFDALDAAGIHTVCVGFDGDGDEGQIEGIDAFNADNATIAIPGQKIEFKRAIYARPAITSERRTPYEVIEQMAYDLLERSHSGWENNDGAFGEFTFSVPERTISLSFNERYTESTNHQHEF